MPQIGWFEILIVAVIAILVIGPKEFPIILRKIGGWVGSFKNYFSDFQKDITDIENSVDEQVSFQNDSTNLKNNKKKDE